MSFLTTEDTGMIAKVEKQVMIASREDVASTVALERLNVPYVVEQVRIGDIDTSDDTFQTRLGGGGFLKSMAVEYAERMKKGDVFPTVTLQRKLGKVRFRVVCGRHRAHAMLAAFGNDAVVFAKVVSREIPSDMLKCAGLRDNTTNGMQQGSAEAAKYVARLLLNTPIDGQGIEHSSKSINTYAGNAGASPSTVRTHYYALLAENALVGLGVDISKMSRGVLAELWKFRTAGAWSEIVSAVSQFPDLANLEPLLQKARIAKSDPALIPQQIRDAGVKASPTQGKWYPRKHDPVDTLIEHLVLAERCFANLDPRRNLDEERADEIVAAVECTRRAMKAWRDK